MRAVGIRELPHLHKKRCRCSPAQKNRPSRWETRQFSKEITQPIRGEAFHQILVSVVDNAVQQERVALGENGRRYFRRALRSQHPIRARISFPRAQFAQTSDSMFSRQPRPSRM